MPALSLLVCFIYSNSLGQTYYLPCTDDDHYLCGGKPHFIPGLCVGRFDRLHPPVYLSSYSIKYDMGCDGSNHLFCRCSTVLYMALIKDLYVSDAASLKGHWNMAQKPNKNSQLDIPGWSKPEKGACFHFANLLAIIAGFPYRHSSLYSFLDIWYDTAPEQAQYYFRTHFVLGALYSGCGVLIVAMWVIPQIA